MLFLLACSSVVMFSDEFPGLQSQIKLNLEAGSAIAH